MNAIDPSRGASCDQALLSLIRNGCPVIVTYLAQTGWCLFKGRFLEGDPNTACLSVKVSRSGDPDGTLAAQEHENVSLTFRTGRQKWMFSATVQSTVVEVDAVVCTVRWPETIQRLKRRAFERAEPPKGTAITVRFQPVEGKTGGQNDSNRVRDGLMENISAGGMCVRITERLDAPTGGIYHCAFTPDRGEPCVQVDAILRHKEAFGRGRGSLGFQFVGLALSDQGRRTLKLLAHMTDRFQRVNAHSGR